MGELVGKWHKQRKEAEEEASKRMVQRPLNKMIKLRCPETDLQAKHP